MKPNAKPAKRTKHLNTSDEEVEFSEYIRKLVNEIQTTQQIRAGVLYCPNEKVIQEWTRKRMLQDLEIIEDGENDE